MKPPAPLKAIFSGQSRNAAATEGGFIGAARVQKEIAIGREAQTCWHQARRPRPRPRRNCRHRYGGRQIGVITSGGFGPTANGPVAMGYVETAFAKPGTAIQLIVRDKPMPAQDHHPAIRPP